MKAIITDHRTFNFMFSTPYYLTIEGGQGHGDTSKSGTYKFTATYLNPDQEKYRTMHRFGTMCLSAFCKEAKIKFWHADAIETLIEQMKDLDIEDITTMTSDSWKQFENAKKEERKRDLQRELKIANDYINEIPTRKRAIRKDGNLRIDLQREMDNYKFRKEKLERQLDIYKPQIK